jgi:superfamily II DNA or RNA helicase
MPPVGSPEAPYPPRPGEAARDHTAELETEIERLRQALDDVYRRLREAEAARDAEARTRVAADTEVLRQRGEAAELLGRLRWLESAVVEAQRDSQQRHEQLQEAHRQMRLVAGDLQRVHQAAADQIAAAEQSAREATEAAETATRDAAEAAARYVEQADARWAELADEAAVHETEAEALRATLAAERAATDALTGPLNDTITRLRTELAKASADRDFARTECVELEAELNRLLFRPTPEEVASAPQLAEPVDPVAAPDHPVSLASGVDVLPWQRDALEAWAAASYRGVIASVSGADRRRLGQWAIARALDDNLKVLVLVTNVERADGWYDELREALPINRVGKYVGRLRSGEFDVVVATADAAAKESIFGFAGNVLVIADEVESIGTPELSVALDEIFERRLGLTSLYERDDHGVATYLTPYFGEVVFSLGYDRAIAESAIAEFDLALIGVTFSVGERASYDEYDQQVREAAAKLLSDYAVPADDFAAEVELLANGRGGHARSAARTYQKAVAKRDEVLSRAATKDVIARTLIHFPGAAHALVFSAATRGNADLIGSKDGAEFGIALSASGSKREMAERLGRLTGSGPRGSRRRLAVVYVEDTVEDDRTEGNVTFLADVAPHAHVVRRFDSGMLDDLADFLS